MIANLDLRIPIDWDRAPVSKDPADRDLFDKWQFAQFKTSKFLRSEERRVG